MDIHAASPLTSPWSDAGRPITWIALDRRILSFGEYDLEREHGRHARLVFRARAAGSATADRRRVRGLRRGGHGGLDPLRHRPVLRRGDRRPPAPRASARATPHRCRARRGDAAPGARRLPCPLRACFPRRRRHAVSGTSIAVPVFAPWPTGCSCGCSPPSRAASPFPTRSSRSRRRRTTSRR